VVVIKKGRERHCTARLGALGEVTRWAEQYKKFWDDRLDILEGLLNE